MDFYDLTLEELIDKAKSEYSEAQFYNSLKREAEEQSENTKNEFLSKQYDKLSELFDEAVKIAIAIRHQQQTSNVSCHFDREREVYQQLLKEQKGHPKHPQDSLVDKVQQ